MKTYHQLTKHERSQIADGKGARLSDAAIARRLGRHRSTIGRERRRNRSRRGSYEWYHAHCLARSRRSHSRRNRRIGLLQWALVHRHLERRWTPEQIGQLRDGAGHRWISYETIYQYLRRDKAAGGTWYQWLPQGRRQRHRHFHRRSRGGPRGRSITERPAIVAARQQIGHWEIDTVKGKGRACLVTAVERVTGYVVIGKLPACTEAEFTRRTLRLLRPHQVRTLTMDNGSEMTGYHQLQDRLGLTCYFTQPYSAWQRGSIENVNGLIRRYLPKGTDLSPLTQHQCNHIARELNQRPRKRLNWHTPEECYGS